MSKRVGFRVLTQSLKLKSKLSVIACFLLSIFFAFSALNVPIYAEGPADSLTFYDLETDRASATKFKKVTIEGYIGDVGGGGTNYSLAYDEISVISEDPNGNTGFYTLDVSQFTIVNKDGDVHNGMYYFETTGRPFYDENTNPYTYKIRICLLAEDHTFAQCTDEISFGNDKKAAAASYALTTRIDDPVDVGFFNVQEEDKDEEDPTCLSENGLVGYIFCPLVDGLQEAISGIYESTIANALNVPPELLKFDNDASSMSAGDSTYEVWGYFRTIANIAFAILIFVMIFSQITGVGISNYGIKKLLPRVVACVVLVNLSYFVCQLAVDLSNVLGQSIGDLIEKMAEQVTIPSIKGVADGFGVAANLTAMLVVIVGAIVSLALNPALLIPLIPALGAGLVAIFALFVTLGIRRAAIVILVAVSPIAFICYVLPNTKNIFDKWLNLFKALLLAFPITSIMVYGGLFAAKVLIATWGPTVWYSLLAGFAVSVVPYFFIPKTINGALGKLNTIVAKASHNLSNNFSRSFSQSGIAEGLQASANQKHLDRLAHYKPEVKHGPFKNLRNRARTRYNAKRPVRADRYLQDAMNGHKFDADHAVRKQDPNYIANSERNMRIKEREEEYATRKYTPMQLGTMLYNAHQNGDDIGRAAIMHTLSKTQDGITQIEGFLDSGLHSSEELASIGSAFSQKEIEGLAHKSPFAAAVLDAARRGENVGTGSMVSFNLSNSPLTFNMGADYENYSGWTKQQLRANAESNYDSEFSVQYTRSMEEMMSNAELTNGVTLDSQNNAKDYLAQRNAEITAKANRELQKPSSFSFDPSAPPAYMDGIQMDPTGPNAEDKVFLIGQTMKYAESGDLIGLEAAVRKLDQISAMELSGTSGDARLELEAQQAAFKSSAFDKIVAPSFSFKSGVSRDAVVGQVSLFRTRSS